MAKDYHDGPETTNNLGHRGHYRIHNDGHKVWMPDGAANGPATNNYDTGPSTTITVSADNPVIGTPAPAPAPAPAPPPTVIVNDSFPIVAAPASAAAPPPPTVSASVPQPTTNGAASAQSFTNGPEMVNNLGHHGHYHIHNDGHKVWIADGPKGANGPATNSYGTDGPQGPQAIDVSHNPVGKIPEVTPSPVTINPESQGIIATPTAAAPPPPTVSASVPQPTTNGAASAQSFTNGPEMVNNLGHHGHYHIHNDGHKVWIADGPKGANGPATNSYGTDGPQGPQSINVSHNPVGKTVEPAHGAFEHSGDSQHSTGGLVLNNTEPLHHIGHTNSAHDLLLNGEPSSVKPHLQSVPVAAAPAAVTDPLQSPTLGDSTSSSQEQNTSQAGSNNTSNPDTSDSSQDTALGGSADSTQTDGTDPSTDNADPLSGGADTPGNNSTDSGTINLQSLVGNIPNPVTTGADGSTTINAGPVNITRNTDGSETIKDGPLNINISNHGVPSFSTDSSQVATDLGGSNGFPATSSYAFPNSGTGSESANVLGIAAAGGISADGFSGASGAESSMAGMSASRSKWARLHPRNWGSARTDQVQGGVLPISETGNSAVVGNFIEKPVMPDRRVEGWGADAKVPPDPANSAVAVDRRHLPNPLDDEKDINHRS